MKLSKVLRSMAPKVRKKAEARLRAMTPHQRDELRRRLHEMKGQTRP